MADVRNLEMALITGASAGIGKEFALKLAQRGYDLILVARREERLKALSDKLSQEFNINCEVIAADLAREDDADRVFNKVAATENISMLINNAGFGTQGFLAETGFSRQVDMINVHVLAAVKLTRAAVVNMIKNGRGDIINVSSVAGFFYGGGSVNYCATKAFLINFSQGLQLEVKEKNIRVQALCPGFTVTEFHDSEELGDFDRSQVPKSLWMSAEKVVDESLRCLEKNKAVCVPGLRYKIIVALLKTPIIGSLLQAHGRRRRR